MLKLIPNMVEDILPMSKDYISYTAWCVSFQNLIKGTETYTEAHSRISFDKHCIITSTIIMPSSRGRLRMTIISSNYTFVSLESKYFQTLFTFVERLTIPRSSSLPRHPPPTVNVHGRHRRARPSMVQSFGPSSVC